MWVGDCSLAFVSNGKIMYVSPPLVAYSCLYKRLKGYFLCFFKVFSYRQ